MARKYTYSAKRHEFKGLQKFGIEIGQKFNSLTVVGDHRKAEKGYEILFVCDCGEQRWALPARVKANFIKSCAKCGKKRQFIGGWNKGHGLSETTEHRIWYCMVSRTTNPNNKSWKNYGGRGIDCCERWRGENGFLNFLEDMGKRPEGKSLDRTDNDKGYSPENCQWMSRRHQNLNKRGIIHTTINGVKIAAADIALPTGLESKWIRDRIAEGMNGEEIIKKSIKALEKLLELG